MLLLEHNKDQSRFSVPENFGELHGNIFKDFVQSSAYKTSFSKAPVICLSVSSKDVYRRTGNEHPVLGIEYAQEGVSLTERYFSKMGLQVRYFMPKHSVAPLAFYFSGDLLSDYTSLELIATISTMETFQKYIVRRFTTRIPRRGNTISPISITWIIPSPKLCMTGKSAACWR